MTLTSVSPLPRLAFVGSNGAPLSGGKLFTYLGGTSTPATTYTDSTGNTANTNPVILDTYGSCNCWLTPGVAYKFILSPSTDTNPPTNPIWTVDNVSTLFGLYTTAVSPAPTSANTGWIDESAGTLRYWSNGPDASHFGAHEFFVRESGGSPNTAIALNLANNLATFGSGQSWDIWTPNGRGIFQYTGSGNVAIVQNISGASSYDSALSFNDGQTNLHSGDGIEHGAIGWHQGAQFPFDNAFFIEASNDPESGSSTNPPSPLKIINTGYYNSHYASRTRMSFDSAGTIQFYDGSSIGFSDGVSIMEFPVLAATGIAINILSVGPNGPTPEQGAAFMSTGLNGAGTNKFGTVLLGAADTNLNNNVFMGLHGTRTTDTTYKLFDYYDTDGGGTALWRVLANGDTYNKNGTYGMLSDDREKFKYGDMPTTADIFEKIDFGRYRYKLDEVDSGDRAPYRFGPYAQQLIDVLPPEYSDFLISEIDFDASGTQRFSLNATAFSMLTAKTLQEEIIARKNLEARLSALEGKTHD